VASLIARVTKVSSWADMNTLRVAVAGAGLGGLCLAQGLLRAGADVTVYERDASLAGRRQGYEQQMREYGYAAVGGCAAVAASRQAEAELGARRGGLMAWLYRRLAQA